MDVILASVHGDVEVSLDAVHESVTLLDVLRVVSPTPVPKAVYVDGRALPAGTLVSASGMVSGSVVSLSPPAPPATASAVTLVQVAGEGSGSRCALRPGRYVVGAARRANMSPMSPGEVLQPHIELTVEHDLSVVVRADSGDLDGLPVGAETPWLAQLLRIGSRVFRLERAIEDSAAVTPRPATGQLELGAATAGGSLPPAIGIRRRHPDVAEAVRRAMGRSTRLWRRTAGDADAFTFSVGLADQPAADVGDGSSAVWPAMPVVVDLANERGVAFVSDAQHARAAARALVLQACVACAPGDLDLVVLANPAGASRWEWVKWLPHARSSQGVQVLSDHDAIADWINAQRTLTSVVASVQALERPIPPSHITLVVLDDPTLWRGRAAVLRSVFAETNLPVRFVALTDDADDVPAVCSTVVTILPTGSARLDSPVAGSSLSEVAPFLLDHDLATSAARRLSPLVDRSAPRTERAVLPTQVSLAALVDVEGLEPTRTADRWQVAAQHRRLRFPIGVGLDGTIYLDLVDDGPSVVIVGGPRSGKTDTLCNLLTSVLLCASPQTVSVVTVEATPRSNFDELASLPHFAGRIEQFTERRGARLLRSLRAETLARARALRNLHVATVAEYNATVDVDPMPQLLIAIDDADVIAGRSTSFLGQLVELVEASRHLGLHLLLTSGQFSKAFQTTVRTLTGVRIALRMHDPAEAIDLVGTREPVHLPGQCPGRAVVTTRTAAARALQIASAAAPSTGLLEVVPFVVARGLNAAERRLAAAREENDGRLLSGSFRSLRDVIDDTQQLVEGLPAKTVLCAELPALVRLEDLAEPATAQVTDSVAIGRADLPDEQRIGAYWWNPARDGNIALIGGTSAERAEVIATYALAAGRHFPSSRVRTYLIDASSQLANQHLALEGVERLHNCAGAVAIDDPDRVLRLLGHLDSEVDLRSALDDISLLPTVVLLINDLGALLRDFDLGGDFELGGKMLSRIIEVGPGSGIHTVMSAAGESTVPVEVLEEFRGRVVLSLDDRTEYRAFAIEPARIPGAVAGRAITVPEQTEIQLASIGDLDAAIADIGAARGRLADEPVPAVDRIAVTPESIGFADVVVAAGHDEHGWSLPIGLHAHTLQPLAMTLSVGEGALIVGEGGTGKAAVLEVIVRAVLDTRGAAAVYGIAAAHRPFFDLVGFAGTAVRAGIGELVDEVLRHPDRERLVVIDEVGLDAGDPALRRLAQAAGGRLTLLVAGRARQLEDPDHWSAPLRRFGTGVLVRPLAGDGAVFGLHLSSSASQTMANRALLVQHGTTTPVLLANQPAEQGAG